MPIHSRLVFCTACTVLVVLACISAGCSSYQAAPAPAAPPAASPAVTPAATAGGNTIAIKNFAFDPVPLAVTTGTTVTWTNQDSVPHIIASDTGSPVPFTSGSLSNGASYSFTFTQAGTYPYHCTIHPSMKGTVVVQ